MDVFVSVQGTRKNAIIKAIVKREEKEEKTPVWRWEKAS